MFRSFRAGENGGGLFDKHKARLDPLRERVAGFAKRLPAPGTAFEDGCDGALDPKPTHDPAGAGNTTFCSTKTCRGRTAAASAERPLHIAEVADDLRRAIAGQGDVVVGTVAYRPGPQSERSEASSD